MIRTLEDRLAAFGVQGDLFSEPGPGLQVPYPAAPSAAGRLRDLEQAIGFPDIGLELDHRRLYRLVGAGGYDTADPPRPGCGAVDSTTPCRPRYFLRTG